MSCWLKFNQYVLNSLHTDKVIYGKFKILYICTVVIAIEFQAISSLLAYRSIHLDWNLVSLYLAYIQTTMNYFVDYLIYLCFTFIIGILVLMMHVHLCLARVHCSVRSCFDWNSISLFWLVHTQLWSERCLAMQSACLSAETNIDFRIYVDWISISLFVAYMHL